VSRRAQQLADREQDYELEGDFGKNAHGLTDAQVTNDCNSINFTI
jgi:hypothetical protein